MTSTKQNKKIVMDCGTNPHRCDVFAFQKRIFSDALLKIVKYFKAAKGLTSLALII